MALVDPELRKLVEANLSELVAQGRSSRYRSCTSFEHICEVMKDYLCSEYSKALLRHELSYADTPRNAGHSVRSESRSIRDLPSEVKLAKPV
jgi:hypothetical protein